MTISSFQALEIAVQPYAANIFMANTLIESIVSSTLVLFIGPWSDKFGRKPILVCIFSGEKFLLQKNVELQ